MILTKDGYTISVDNENHVSAFLDNGWKEVAKTSTPPAKTEEAEAEAVTPVEEKPKPARKPATRRKTGEKK